MEASSMYQNAAELVREESSWKHQSAFRQL